MKISNHLEYGLLGVSLILLQFAGYSVLTLPFLALTAVLMFSFKSLQTQVEESAPFSLFLVTAFIVGLVHLIFRDTTAKSLMMWGQLYFLAIILACGYHLKHTACCRIFITLDSLSAHTSRRNITQIPRCKE